MDEAWLRAINGTLADPVGWLMVMVSTKSTWYAPLAMLLAGILVVDRRKGVIAIVTALIALGIGDSFTFHVLKPFFGRSRPCIELENIRVLMGCVDSYSMPSNHAVNSMAFAGVMGGFFRPLLWTLVPIGLLVCLSRVVVGVHYPMDVILGGILGLGLGLGLSMAARKITERNKIEDATE